jgi:hypothetical protein
MDYLSQALLESLRSNLAKGASPEEVQAQMQDQFNQFTPDPSAMGSVEQPEVELPKVQAPKPPKVGPDTLAGYAPQPIQKDPVQAALEKQLEEKTQASIAAQQQAIADAEQGYQALANKPLEPNYSALGGLYNLLDRTGNKLEVSPREQTDTQRRAELKALRDAINKQKGGLSDDQIGFLKAELARKTQNQDASRQARFDQNLDTKLFQDVQKQATNLTKDAADFKQITSNLDKAYTPDEHGKIAYARVKQSLSSFSRLMGEKGVLTDTDVARQWREPVDAIIAKYASLGDPNAKIDARDVQVLVAAMKDAKESFADAYKMKADNFSSQFQDPYSPMAGRKWAPKMMEKIYSPIADIRSSKSTASTKKQPSQPVDHAAGAAAELARRGIR